MLGVVSDTAAAAVLFCSVAVLFVLGQARWGRVLGRSTLQADRVAEAA